MSGEAIKCACKKDECQVIVYFDLSAEAMNVRDRYGNSQLIYLDLENIQKMIDDLKQVQKVIKKRNKLMNPMNPAEVTEIAIMLLIALYKEKGWKPVVLVVGSSILIMLALFFGLNWLVNIFGAVTVIVMLLFIAMILIVLVGVK